MKLESLSSSNIFLMLRIKEMKLLTYSWTDFSCLSFFNSSLAIHYVLLGRNCSFSFCLKRSQILILECSAFKSSFILFLYHNLTPPMRYVIVITTWSTTLILATLKYCSIFHIKFSSSLEPFSPSNYLPHHECLLLPSLRWKLIPQWPPTYDLSWIPSRCTNSQPF